MSMHAPCSLKECVCPRCIYYPRVGSRQRAFVGALSHSRVTPPQYSNAGEGGGRGRKASRPVKETMWVEVCQEKLPKPVFAT
eukprot:2047-Eustigmatos_ZCMA.PRE.1